MRYVIFSVFLIAILAFTACNEQKDLNTYTVNLTIEGAPDTWVYMEHQIDNKWIKFDSAELKSGKAVFTGELEQPEFFFIKIKDQSNYLPAFIGTGVTTVNGSTTNPNQRSVVGSQSQDEFASLTDSLNAFTRKSRELGMQYQEARSKNDTVLMQELENKYYKIDSLKSSFLLNFAIENPSSVASAFVISNNSHLFDLEELDLIVSSYDPTISNSIYVEKLATKVNTLKKVSVGQPYIDFTLNDPDGNPVSLSSVVGTNYVLIDFWAAWCQPCRAENPNVVEAYNSYHDKGFDVFGVSFDKELESWKKAIEDDGLTWTQVSDLQYWGSAAGKIYGIQSIPQNILLDPSGIIIEKNLRGKELQDKLAELFK